jgi:hypothetical protein
LLPGYHHSSFNHTPQPATVARRHLRMRGGWRQGRSELGAIARFPAAMAFGPGCRDVRIGPTYDYRLMRLAGRLAFDVLCRDATQRGLRTTASGQPDAALKAKLPRQPTPSSSVVCGGSQDSISPHARGAYCVGPIEKQARWRCSAMPTLPRRDGRGSEHRAGCGRAWVDGV